VETPHSMSIPDTPLKKGLKPTPRAPWSNSVLQHDGKTQGGKPTTKGPSSLRAALAEKSVGIPKDKKPGGGRRADPVE